MTEKRAMIYIHGFFGDTENAKRIIRDALASNRSFEERSIVYIANPYTMVTDGRGNNVRMIKVEAKIEVDLKELIRIFESIDDPLFRECGIFGMTLKVAEGDMRIIT